MSSILKIIKNNYPTLANIKVVTTPKLVKVFIENDKNPSIQWVKQYITGTQNIEELIKNSAVLKIRHMWNLGYKQKDILKQYPELENISELMHKVQGLK